MRLIDVEEVYCEQCEYKDRCKEMNDENALFCDVYHMPTINPADLVPKGRWENVTGGMVTLGDCSECKKRQLVCGTNFCNNCGADMREEKNDRDTGGKTPMKTEKTMKDFAEAFGNIAWYNGHVGWLRDVLAELERDPGAGYRFVTSKLFEPEWLSDRHALWMMLVGLFGNWGTSIRYGWIEDRKGAAKFIRVAIADCMDEDVGDDAEV